jgi:aspartate kinase
MGVAAVSQLAFQVGIQTCPSHGSARIKNIDGGKIGDLLAKKNVVIIAGFQGITEWGDLTTLGRGGSDLTALAIAHRFQADRCEIYTDVPGVHTADPKMVKNAKIIERIDFESLLQLSFFDNKIMQDRSVAFAKKSGIPFTISSIFDKFGKTVVDGNFCDYESAIVGITSKTGLCLISCESDEDIVFDILEFFKKNNADVGFVKHGRRDLSFFDEISIGAADLKNLITVFRGKFRGYFGKFDVMENLSRIDAVVANVQWNSEILHIFDAIPRQSILRYECGKHGISVLIRSDGGEYEAMLNDIHDRAFGISSNGTSLLPWIIPSKGKLGTARVVKAGRKLLPLGAGDW